MCISNNKKIEMKVYLSSLKQQTISHQINL